MKNKPNTMVKVPADPSNDFFDDEDDPPECDQEKISLAISGNYFQWADEAKTVK